METETQDTLTSLNISVLVSQKNYLEERAMLEGLAAPSEYLRQLISEDQERKAQEELERMLVAAIESDKWIEGSSEYWAEKRAQLATRYDHATKAE
jgi:antitoxin ParD1/3/4